jgi:hypothetical protein
MGVYQIRTLRPEQLDEDLDSLVALLQDAVESGASVGFVPPMHPEDARAYWAGVIPRYALSAAETFDPTVYMYREIEPR